MKNKQDKLSARYENKKRQNINGWISTTNVLIDSREQLRVDDAFRFDDESVIVRQGYKHYKAPVDIWRSQMQGVDSMMKNKFPDIPDIC